MDDADRAQGYEEKERIAAIKAATGQTSVMIVTMKGKRVCRDCLVKIDKERIKAHPFANRCIKCQSIFEDCNGST